MQRHLRVKVAANCCYRAWANEVGSESLNCKDISLARDADLNMNQ